MSGWKMIRRTATGWPPRFTPASGGQFWPGGRAIPPQRPISWRKSGPSSKAYRPPSPPIADSSNGWRPRGGARPRCAPPPPCPPPPPPESRPQGEGGSAAEPTDRRCVQWLATAWRVEAQLRASSDLPAAAAAATRAVELGEKLRREGRATDADVGECATACEVAGDIAAQAGAGAAAKGDWQHAAEMLAPRLPATRDWRLLDPAARVAARMGRSDDARATISKLTQLGYVPLDPWPDIERAAAAGISNPKP